MIEHIYRSNQEPVRKELTWEQQWKGSDNGIIICWEVGRQKSNRYPDLAKNGELPILEWTGGIGEKIKKKKYGSLNYLAQWQGLRGEDLDINLSKEKEIICSTTGTKVIFTSDASKYSKP